MVKITQRKNNSKSPKKTKDQCVEIAYTLNVYKRVIDTEQKNKRLLKKVSSFPKLKPFQIE